jgi:hypothetical protein
MKKQSCSRPCSPSDFVNGHCRPDCEVNDGLISPATGFYGRYRDFIRSCPRVVGSSFPDVVSVLAPDLRPPVLPDRNDLRDMGYYASNLPVLPAIVHHSHNALCVCPDCLSSLQKDVI